MTDRSRPIWVAFTCSGWDKPVSQSLNCRRRLVLHNASHGAKERLLNLMPARYYKAIGISIFISVAEIHLIGDPRLLRAEHPKLVELPVIAALGFYETQQD